MLHHNTLSLINPGKIAREKHSGKFNEKMRHKK
jgi:hypothetical protein